MTQISERPRREPVQLPITALGMALGVPLSSQRTLRAFVRCSSTCPPAGNGDAASPAYRPYHLAMTFKSRETEL